MVNVQDKKIRNCVEGRRQKRSFCLLCPDQQSKPLNFLLILSSKKSNYVTEGPGQ
jgi:hypothetical protein